MFRKIDFKVAGVTFKNQADNQDRQTYLRFIQTRDRDTHLWLKREPKNQADPNAIAVVARTITPAGKQSGEITVGPFKIGYVPKQTAAWLSKIMDKGLSAYIVRTRRYGRELNWISTSPKKATLGCAATIIYECEPEVAVELEKQ